MFEVPHDLLLASHFLNHVIGFHPEVKDMLDCVGWKFPELLGSERELRHIFARDALALQVLFSPFYELCAVHARHLVVKDHQSHLVLFLLVVKSSDGIGNRAAVGVEARLVIQLQFVRYDVLQRNL
jgi:hypothetical protein